MTGSTSLTAAPLIKPEQIGPLIEIPLRTQAVSWAVSQLVPTTSPVVRFPIVTNDPSASWTAEASPISPSDGSYDEVLTSVCKLSQITKCSNELISDAVSNASALQVLTDGIVADLARKCDLSYFGSQVANSPKGLADLANVTEIPSVGTLYDDLGWAVDVITAMRAVGAEPAAFVASYETVGKLMKIPTFSGTAATSAVPVLATTSGDVSQPLGTSLFGVKVHALPQGVLADDVVYGIPARKAFVVLRSGTSIEVDRSVYFESDCSAIRSVLRCAWSWPHPEAVVRVLGGGGS